MPSCSLSTLGVGMGPILFNMFITTSVMAPKYILNKSANQGEWLMLVGVLRFSVILRSWRTGPTEML